MSTLLYNVIVPVLLIGPLLLVSTAACTHVGEMDPQKEAKAEAVRETTTVPVERHRFEYKQVHMGVQARLVVYAPDSARAERAAQAAFDRIADLDAVMSDYRRDSELMRLVRHPAGEPVAVSEDLYRVLEASQTLAEESDGAFDVTVGPVVRLWREARRSGALPPAGALDSARAVSGYDLLSLRSEDSTVVFRVDGMQLDLGGIAKGFAADEALQQLRAHGVPQAMIEFGGDVVAADPPPGQEGWQVTAALAGRTFQLDNAAVSTSGDTEQFVEIGGTRYSHVVDPRTGLGLTHRLAATVVAPSGMLADALSTALSVLGPDDGREMLARYPEAEAVFRHAEE